MRARGDELHVVMVVACVRATSAGRYEMQMRVDDPGIRTRGLDSAFYARVVTLG